MGSAPGHTENALGDDIALDEGRTARDRGAPGLVGQPQPAPRLRQLVVERELAAERLEREPELGQVLDPGGEEELAGGCPRAGGSPAAAAEIPRWPIARCTRARLHRSATCCRTRGSAPRGLPSADLRVRMSAMMSSIALTVFTRPVAMAPRSKASVVIATFQPPSTSPTTAASGRKTSSRNTSLNSASPSMWASGRRVPPGASIGSRK